MLIRSSKNTAHSLFRRRRILVIRTRRGFASGAGLGRSLLTRLPVLLGAGVATGAAVVHNKFNELKDRFNSWKDYASETAKTTASSLSSAWEQARQTLESVSSSLTSEGGHNDVTSSKDLQDKDSAAAVAALKNKQPEYSPSSSSSRSDQSVPDPSPPPSELMNFTRKLIDVRNMLKTVHSVDGGKDAFTLPSIVVIGSQSSGKSSVLEAIVGHEFLPKGSNMVTRRPIELTLVYTPNTKEEYGEFPQLGIGKIKDFSQIQKTLTDLNLAVPETDCVSPDPIELVIKSPNVPDLTLIDLPGFIQIHNKDQPPILREKIAQVCDSYIREPNIILAVCAADVDLANSEALRASRRVDPRGTRTIGVVTKMDLVDGELGAHILKNNNYPLKLGYVGVVCKSPNSSGVSSSSSSSLIPYSWRSPASSVEAAYFKSYPVYQEKKAMVGTSTLRLQLMQVLESHMKKSLSSIHRAVQSELEDARYQLKVEYNDRRISAESYISDTMDLLKARFKDYSATFTKPQIRQQIKALLEDKIVEICKGMYWSDLDRVTMLPRTCKVGGGGGSGSSTNAGGSSSPSSTFGGSGDASSDFWSRKLDVASSSLTKSGIGRSTTQLIVDMLHRNMERLTSIDPFIHHQGARTKILESSNEMLRSKFHLTVDQVENTIKPYKYEVECTEGEWKEGVKGSVAMLDRKLGEANAELAAIRSSIGRRRLRQAISYLQNLEQQQRQQHNRRGGGGGGGGGISGFFSSMLGLNAARSSSSSSTSTLSSSSPSSDASKDSSSLVSSPSSSVTTSSAPGNSLSSSLTPSPPPSPSTPPPVQESPFSDQTLHRAQQVLELQSYVKILQSRVSALKSRQCSTSSNAACCPEAYLEVVSDKLAYTAAMFIQLELLNEFFFQMPKELESQLYYGMRGGEVDKFAKENPVVKRHLECLHKKETLESVMNKLRGLM